VPFGQITPRPLNLVGVNTYAPASSGVYGLTNAREWIYIGETDNVKNELLGLLKDFDTPLMKHEPTGLCLNCAITRAGLAARIVWFWNTGQLITGIRRGRPAESQTRNLAFEQM